MTEPQQTPAEALETIRKSRNAVREAVRDKKHAFRYGLTYSVIAGLMVGGQVLPLPFNILSSTGGAVGFALLAKNWSARTGIWISGVTPKKARWVAFGLGAVMLALMISGVWAGRAGQTWLGLPLAVAGFGAAMGGSWLWMRVFLAEIRDQ